MKNNKKLAIAGVSALGLAAVGFGAFAFFSDSAEQNTDGSPVYPEGDYSYRTELWENTIEEYNSKMQ